MSDKEEKLVIFVSGLLRSNEAAALSSSSALATKNALSLTVYSLSSIIHLFASSEAVQTYITTEVYEKETKPATTTPPANSGFLSYFYKKKPSSTSSTPEVADIEQELLYIHRFFEALESFRLESDIKEDKCPPLSICPVFKNLKHLEISGHPLSIIQDFDKLGVNLLQLTCINNLSPDTAFYYLEHTTPLFPNVTDLNLSSNCLKDIPVQFIRHFPSCKMLRLNNNQFSEIPSSLFDHLPQLVELNLSTNSITSLHTEISSVSSLTSLNVANNSLENLQGIEVFKSLKVLDVSSNKIDDVYEVGRAAVLNSLEETRLSGNPLTKLVIIVLTVHLH